MKLRLIIFAFLVQTCSTLLGQSLGINYQGIARDGSGDPLAGQTISLQISLVYDAMDGTIAYRETHDVTTNQFGLFSIVIGNGSASMGVFSSIDWNNPIIWLQVEMDSQGGSNFSLVGSQQLQAVPYAKYAETTNLQAGSGISITGNTISNSSPDVPVTITGTGTVATSGVYPNFQITGSPQDLEIITDELKITSNPNATPIDLSGYRQTLSLIKSGNVYDISLSNGNMMQVDVTDNDDDSTNEIQDLQGVLGQGNDAAAGTITNLATPANSSDAATKQYVDDGDADYAFKANIAFTTSGTSNEQVVFSSLDINESSVVASNTFTAPVDGVYMFVVQATADAELNLFIRKTSLMNEDYEVQIGLAFPAQPRRNYNGQIIWSLQAGDTVQLINDSGAELLEGIFFGYKL